MTKPSHMAIPTPSEAADFTPPERGKLTQIADDLFWARFDLPFRLNHINLYILDSGDGWVVVDCGINTDHTAEHWGELLAGPLAGKPVAEIIVTHHHLDHIGYAGTLAKITGAPVVMTRPEYDFAARLVKTAGTEYGGFLVDAYKRYGLDEEILELARSDDDRYVKHIAPLPEPKIVASGDVVKSRLGEWQIRTDCGHSLDQIGLTDTARKIYIAGDFLLPRISPNVSTDLMNSEEDRLGAYMVYLADMAASLPDDMLVLPGHDWPFYEGAKRAEVLIKHHEGRLAALLDAAAKAPISIAEAMKVLFLRKFGKHEVFFASGEAHAHLVHLVTTGRMEKNLENGVMRFSLK